MYLVFREELMKHSSLFDNVHEKDYLEFFEGTKLNFQKVIKFAELESKDVARAADVPLASVRYDEKIPKELRQRIIEWANLFNLVAGYFHGDPNKTAIWFKVPNPLLGEISPRDMIRIGRYKKLVSFVMNSLSENRRAG
jgi:hypothetical protein